jgi:UDP-N-acetylmuramoyl-tripeptide--D-alanyl-D-alanine ligase
MKLKKINPINDILNKHFYFKISDFLNNSILKITDEFNLNNFKDYYILFPYSINTDTRIFQENLNLIDNLNKALIEDKLKFIKIFVCIKGENFDSHNFINEILEKNINLVVIEQNFYQLNKENLTNLFKKYNKAFIVVNDSIKFIGLISKIFIKKVKAISDLKVIGITGSAGKTTTKNILYNLLSFFFKDQIIYSKKSFNNELGVPFTIFSINKYTKYAILEMGMRGFGQIEYLANIADVDYGIITSIGPAHILKVGNIIGVNKAKGELIEYLINNNKEFFILPTEYKIKKHVKNPKSFILPNKNYHIFNYKIINKNKTFFTIFNLKFGKLSKKFEINSILSKGILRNFLMTLFFINKLLNLKLNKIKEIKNEVLLNFFNFIEKDLFNKSLEENRFNFKTNGNLYMLDDCYNSNPLSMKENLNVVFKISKYFDKVYLIFGDMLELGKFSKFYHLLIFKKILNLLTKNKDKIKVFLVGPEFNKILNKINKNDILNNDILNDVLSFENVDDLINHIRQLKIRDNKEKILIDIKGSRAIHLEKVVNILLSDL